MTEPAVTTLPGRGGNCSGGAASLAIMRVRIL